MSQGVNYLDLIKNPRMKAGKSAETLKNNNMKENTWSSPQSAASSYGKKSKNIESDYLGELDIRQLTNTRHKHKKNKEMISGNMGMLTKEEQQKQYQLQQCPNNNQQTLMQNSYLLRKNQQSPLVYNREAERFSYIYDPMISSQLQEQNPAWTREYQQQFQAAQQFHSNQINIQKQPTQQYYNYSSTPNVSQPQQQWQYLSSPYLPGPYCNQTSQQRDFQENYKSINQQQQQYQNIHKSYQEPLIRQDLLTLNNEISRMQLQQKQQQQYSTASTDSFVSYGREDSFGNIKQRNNNSNNKYLQGSNPTAVANFNKYFNEQKYSTQNLSNIPYAQQQQTPDLQRYYRKPQGGAFQAGQNKPTGQALRRLLPSINISTVVFVILAMYVVYKNFSKIKGAAETIQYYVFQGNTTANKAGKQNESHNIHTQSPLLTPSSENSSTRYPNSQEFQQKQQQQYFDNTDLTEQTRQEKQDAVIAKVFAKELIKELFIQLREKKRMYKDEYEDSLTHRFSTHMLREILPEVQ